MGEKGSGWFPRFLLSPSSLHPPLNMPRNRLPRSTPGLTCHLQGLQICQAGQGAIADGVDHGAWGSGGPNSEPVKAAISIPSSPLFFSVPSPMPSPLPLSPPPPPPPSAVQSQLLFQCNLHPPYHAPPPPGPGGAPSTGPRPASSTPRTQGSLRHTEGTGEFRRQRPVLSLSSSLRSMPQPPAAGTKSARKGLCALFPRAQRQC